MKYKPFLQELAVQWMLHLQTWAPALDLQTPALSAEHRETEKTTASPHPISAKKQQTKNKIPAFYALSHLLHTILGAR